MRLLSEHGWRARPEHKILVLGGGAVRLEYPGTWFVEPTEDCIKIYDKRPPDADCALGVSYHHWPHSGSALSLASLVRSALETDERSLTGLGPILEEARIDFALAWGQGHFSDERDGREACTRLCIARKADVQALLTFDFWPSDLEACDARWSAFLSSLELAQWVADPRRGPSLA